MVEKVTRFSDKFEFLSNFSSSKIEYQGIIYPTVEHAYQAAKTMDMDKRQEIAYLRTPRAAKKAGKKLHLRKEWDDIKLRIMETLLREKFKCPILKRCLIDTGDVILEEGNTWYDVFWGVDLRTGRGENHLGKLLMEIRQEFLDEEKEN